MTFRDTFAGDNTPQDMERYVAEAFTPQRQAAEIADPSGAMLLVDEAESGDLLAYARLVAGGGCAPVAGQRPMELRRFYVARAWHGRGLADELMAAALAAARARATDVLWLGVWERNARALAFYRRHGFRRVGEQVFDLGGDRQIDWILTRTLTRVGPPAAR